MNGLKTYIPPEAEILYYAAYEVLCYEDRWVRGKSFDGSDNGIELPDDNWGDNGDGGIELPDDKL